LQKRFFERTGTNPSAHYLILIKTRLNKEIYDV
jgi:hypothetical protein